MQRDIAGQREASSGTSASLGQIRDATAEDAAPVSRLVHAGFKAHVAPDWEVRAQAEFLAETTPERLAIQIEGAALCLVHQADADIDGVILLPGPTIVQLFFVASSQMRQGIGTKLWEMARSRVEEGYPEVKTVELNSSPYAVAAYRRLGFFPISEPFIRKGAVATRMACWLPARTLERPTLGSPDAL
jgi:GNAT superfamily N-acetyltransferase